MENQIDGLEAAKRMYAPHDATEASTKLVIQTPGERFEILDAKLDDLREQLREIRAIVRRIENQASL